MTLQALDIGYSGLKVAYSHRPYARPELIALPAGAAPPDQLGQRITGAGRDDDGVRVRLGDSEWIAGVAPERIRGQARELHADYSATPTYTALFHAALAVCGADTIERLVTGLPADQYNDGEHRKALQRRLTGVHRASPDRDVAVRRVHVLPQPAGAFMHLLYTTDEPELVKQGRICVLDVGHFSVDWTLFQRCDMRTTASSRYATSRLLEAASDRIHDDIGWRVSPQRLEHELRRGAEQILVAGQWHELDAYLREAADTVVPNAMAELLQSLRLEADALDMVYLTGGGARLFWRAARQTYPGLRIEIPDRYVEANALGYYRFALAHAQSRGAA